MVSASEFSKHLARIIEWPANRRLSRPSPRAGLVALRHTFVRRCHRGWGFIRACRDYVSLPSWLGFTRACREPAKSGHDGGTGPRSERRRITGRLLPAVLKDLLFRAKDLFMAAMVFNFAPSRLLKKLGG